MLSDRIAVLTSQRPARTVAQDQQQPDTERQTLTSALQREMLASIYVRESADADARENALAIRIADIGSGPLFQEDSEAVR